MNKTWEKWIHVFLLWGMIGGIELSLPLGILAQQTQQTQQAQQTPEVEQAQQVWGVLAVSAQPLDKEWKHIPAQIGFSFPWEKEVAPATVLRLCHDTQKLYFRYDVVDAEIVTEGAADDKRSVELGDRVEIFLATPNEKGTYYCFEMDAAGRVLDYTAQIYRKFDKTWKARGFQCTAVRTADGYRVDGSFELDMLRQWNVLQPDGSFRAGFFRAEFSKAATGKTIERWISWKHTGTVEPDFHVWDAFGPLQLLRSTEEKP